MADRFNPMQEKLFTRLSVLQELVAVQSLREAPCRLLRDQLVELQVITGKLLDTARLLHGSIAQPGDE